MPLTIGEWRTCSQAQKGPPDLENYHKNFKVKKVEWPNNVATHRMLADHRETWFCAWKDVGVSLTQGAQLHLPSE